VDKRNAVDAYYQAGLRHAASGDLDQAILALECCVEMDAHFSDAILVLADLYMQNSRLENALRTYQRARSIDKFRGASTAGIARITRIQGNAEDAYRLIREEMQSMRRDTQMVLALSEICLELGRYPEAIREIEEILEERNISSLEDRKNLLHTAGRLYDKNEMYDKAFEYHRAANELTASRYEPAKFQKRISKIREVYSSDVLKYCNDSCNSNHAPIFIVGMPRAGTTLTEQILSCHSDIYAAGERPTIQQLVARMCEGNYPERMAGIEPVSLCWSAQYYIDHVCSDDHLFTTDKMPHNYLYIGVIRQLFPKAKIINVRRDPIDNCLSIYFQYFNSSHRYATNLSHIAHHYAGYDELMNYWKMRYPDNIYDIHYESVVYDTRNEISRLLEYLGLEWQESCLRHHRSKRHVLTASQQQVNKPIYNNSIGRWKNYKTHIASLLSDLRRYKQVG
jgi:tetratricopeptide (TPR) repeat protein